MSDLERKPSRDHPPRARRNKRAGLAWPEVARMGRRYTVVGEDLILMRGFVRWNHMKT